MNPEDETIDVEEIDADVTLEEEGDESGGLPDASHGGADPDPIDEPHLLDEPKGEDASAPWAKVFSSAEDIVGEIPDSPADEVMSALTKESFDGLQPAARGFIRHLMAAARSNNAGHNSTLSSERAKIRAEQAELAEARKNFTRERSQITEMFSSEKLKQLLADADVPDADMPDAFTEEGMNARMKRAAAREMRALTAPAREVAAKGQRQRAWDEVLARHPEMKNKAFFDRVDKNLGDRAARAVAAAKSRHGELTDIQIKKVRIGALDGRMEDAINEVKLAQHVMKAQARQQRRRANRADSARRVGKARQTAAGMTIEDLSSQIQKDGYSPKSGGERLEGFKAWYAYLSDHPKVKARVLAS